MRCSVLQGKGFTAANDLASDARKLARETVKLQEAVATGYANQADKEELEMNLSQLRSFAELEFQEPDGSIYCVRDYMTKERARKAATRPNLNKKIISIAVSNTIH